MSQKLFWRAPEERCRSRARDRHRMRASSRVIRPRRLSSTIFYSPLPAASVHRPPPPRSPSRLPPLARVRPRPTLSPVSCGSGVGRRTTDPGATVLSPHMLQNRATGDSPNPHRAHSVSSLGLPSRDNASPRPRYGNTRLLMPRPAYPPAAHSGAAEPPPNSRTLRRDHHWPPRVRVRRATSRRRPRRRRVRRGATLSVPPRQRSRRETRDGHYGRPRRIFGTSPASSGRPRRPRHPRTRSRTRTRARSRP